MNLGSINVEIYCVGVKFNNKIICFWIIGNNIGNMAIGFGKFGWLGLVINYMAVGYECNI